MNAEWVWLHGALRDGLCCCSVSMVVAGEMGLTPWVHWLLHVNVGRERVDLLFYILKPR